MLSALEALTSIVHQMLGNTRKLCGRHLSHCQEVSKPLDARYAGTHAAQMPHRTAPLSKEPPNVRLGACGARTGSPNNTRSQRVLVDSLERVPIF